MVAAAVLTVPRAMAGAWNPPDLLPILAGTLASLLVWAAASRLRRQLRVGAAALAGGAGYLAGLGGPLSARVQVPGSEHQSFAIIWLILGAATIASSWPRAKSSPIENERGVPLPALFWLLGAAVLLRWDALKLAVFKPLDPDVFTVIAIADQMRSPYDTSTREPMWVWLSQLFEVIAGEPEAGIRLFSLVASVGLLVVVFVLVRHRFAAASVAVITLALLARHPHLVDSGPRGLRTELYAALIVGLTVLAFAAAIPERRRSIGLILTPAALALTQLNSALISLPLLLFARWRHRLGWWVPGVSVGLLAVLITPHVMHNVRIAGDPLFSVNIHAVFYRNHEFVRISDTGCAGCPEPAALERNSYAGARTTMTTYVFGMHSIREVVSRSADGLRLLYASRGVPSTTVLGLDHPLALPIFWAGLVILAIKRAELVIVPLAAVNLLAFVIPIGLDPRLLMNCAPFFAIATALPLAFVWRLAVRRSLAAAIAVFR